MGRVIPEGAWLLMGRGHPAGGVVVQEGGVVSSHGRRARLRPQECTAPPAPPPAPNPCPWSLSPARWRPPPRSAAVLGMQAGLTN